MKPKTLILMVVAVVCGLGASYMTSRLLAERDDYTPDQPVVQKVELLVAKKNLDMHVAFKAKPEDFFTTKQFTKEEAPKEALTPADMHKLKGKYLRRSLRKNDWILAEDLTDGKFGLNKLPNGMRAVGISVTNAGSAAGFATLPGSRVDIIWTTRVGNDTVTKTLLEGVAVLAADARDDLGEHTGAMPASVVTVALVPDDVLKVHCAQATGTLQLVLRTLDDSSSGDLAQMTHTILLKGGALPKKDEHKQVDPGVKDTNPPVIAHEKRPNIDRNGIDQPEVKPEVDQPQVPKGWKKFTVTQRNAEDVKTFHYWLDENNNIVQNPDVDPSTVPAPAPGKKKDDKKTGSDI